MSDPQPDPVDTPKPQLTQYPPPPADTIPPQTITVPRQTLRPDFGDRVADPTAVPTAPGAPTTGPTPTVLP